MPSDRKVVITEAAELDLAGIWQYGFEHWGIERADVYQEEILARIDQLRLFPESSPRRNLTARGVRALIMKDYVVYYRLTRREIVIRRVVHQARDIRTISGL
jgi:toxin ParE1/3/4